MSGMTPTTTAIGKDFWINRRTRRPDADPGGATNSPGRDRSGNHRRPRDRSRVFRFSGFQILMKADTQISRSGVSYVPRVCENSSNSRGRRFFSHNNLAIGHKLTCVTHSSNEYSHERAMKNHIQYSKIVFTQPVPLGDVHRFLLAVET